jgi:hypothetical protein
MAIRSFALGALFASLLVSTACVSDDRSGSSVDALIKKEIAKLVPFDTVELKGPFHADIRVGSGPDLDIEGPAYLIDALDVHLGSDKLSLIVKDGVEAQKDDVIKVSLDTPSLIGLTLAGASKTTVKTPVGDSLGVEVSGASKLTLDGVDVGELGISVSGAADVTASGKAIGARYTLSGAGAFSAQELIAQDVEVNLSGAGSVRVHATRSVKGAVAGIGKLAVSGAPAERHVTVAGIGDVVYE